MSPARPQPTFLQRSTLARFRASQVPHRFTDVLVLGSGVAGLSAALAAAGDPGTEVLVVSKGQPEDGATAFAQGGIAAAIEAERLGDSLESHVQDTLRAGDGLCDEAVVRAAIEEGIPRVRELIELGAQFDRGHDGRLHFTLEGGHSHPRILHRGDSTGQEVLRALLGAVRSRQNITLLTGTYSLDVIQREGRVVGAVLFRAGSGIEAAWSRAVILATGGCGRVFRETTNPRGATGDGVAIAFRANAILRDLEMIQFHPTALYLAGADRHLITEAVRGEGGILRDGSGERFMPRFHPLADLAPRDVVSRAIAAVMKERRENRVFLDLSAIPKNTIVERFPRIRELLMGFGIDILRDPIPVRPSAHYAIGGVRTDMHGQTSLPGLLAAGEVAATGLHGANRLASNSLLEGLVFGHRAGLRARDLAASEPLPRISSVDGDGALGALEGRESPTGLDLHDLEASLRSLAWLKVGLERTRSGLEEALAQLRAWIPYVLGSQFQDPESWTVQNMLTVAYLMTLFALRREESRGVHFRADFPARDDARWARSLELRREGLEAF